MHILFEYTDMFHIVYFAHDETIKGVFRGKRLIKFTQLKENNHLTGVWGGTGSRENLSKCKNK